MAEEVVFDKAVSAEQLEKEKEQLVATIKDYEKLLAESTDGDKKQVKERIKECRERLKQLEKQTGARDAESLRTTIVETDDPEQNAGLMCLRAPASVAEP